MSQVNLKEGMIVNLVKVNEKEAKTNAESTDILPISDVDGNIKKITVNNLLSPVVGGIGNAITSTVPTTGVNTYNVQGGAGTYTNFLSGVSTPIVFDNTTDSMATKNWQMRKVGTYWQKYEVKYADIQNYVSKQYLGERYLVLDEVISENVTTPTLASGSRTIVLNRQVAVGEKVTGIKLWATVAGNLIIGAYTISGGNIVRTRAATIAIELGENEVNFEVYDFSLLENEYFGFGYNTTTSLGRVGTLVTTALYSHYLYTTNVATTPIPVGSQLTTSRWGVSIELVQADSVKEEIVESNERIDDVNSYLYGDGNILEENTSLMLTPNKWATSTGTPALSFAGGIMSVVMTSGSQNVIASGVLESGKEYLVKTRARIESGTVTNVTFGAGVFASSPSAAQYTATLTGSFQEIEFPLTTGAGTYLAIGVLSANNTGGTVEIDYIRVCDSALSLDSVIDEKVATVGDQIEEVDNYLNGNSNVFDSATSGMTTPNSWVTGFGSPAFTFSSGILTLPVTTGNQGIKVVGKLTIGKTYYIELSARVAAGPVSKLTVGGFAATGSAAQFTLSLSSIFKTYKFQITATSVDFYIGVLTANNTGGTFEVDYVTVNDADLSFALKTETAVPTFMPTNFYLDALFSSLQREAKALQIVDMLGDSLNGNPLGGANITDGATRTPMRLTYNTLSRRVYELFSWNKPTWRRLDDADWTKSGTWSAVNTSAIFEPIYDNETYHESIVSGAYVEITVPSGKENFALMCQTFTALGKVNVTLNGGSIAAYGPTQIDLLGGGETGNPYNVVQYLGLPAGANVIRFSKESNTDKVRIWGGFYWSGNTMIVKNIAHGGHTMAELINEHLPQEMAPGSFDAVIVQLTLMNEMGTSPTTSLDASKTNLANILDNYVDGKDVLVISCHPFGKNPAAPATNYYTIYPGMKERNAACKSVVLARKLPFIDTFTLFERIIINRGGTLEGGESGLWYTGDGQHENNAGLDLWWSIYRKPLSQCPLVS